MDVAEGAVAAVKDGVESKATDQLVDSIWRQFGYFFNYKTNLQDFKDQVGKLKAERVSLQHRIDEAQRNGEEIEPTATLWLETADQTIESANKTLEEMKRAKQSQINCCIGILSSNFRTRYLLSRRASKETPGVREVRDEGRLFDSVSHHTPTALLRFKTFKGFEFFESRTFVFDRIAKELKDGGSRLIGVHGASGVGKTSLVKKIAEKMRKDGVFKLVIAVSLTAGQGQELRGIQQEIADWLDLKLDTESAYIRSARLRNRIENEESILIVLDNVSERIQVEDIGIPTSGGDHKACKVVATSRNKRVLSQIGAEKIFEVEVLQEEEAWRLFEKNLTGEMNLNDPDFRVLAEDVVKRCGGLPAVIEAVANALMNKEDYEWKDFLNQLMQYEQIQSDEQVRLVLQH